MKNNTFYNLAIEYSLCQFLTFSQQHFRKHHYSIDPGTLCSGLTYFWLTEKLFSRSPMSELEKPTAEQLNHLMYMQSLSYYPSFPENYRPGVKEQALLTKKYGTQNWQSIAQQVVDKYQGDYVLYDFGQVFNFESADIAHFSELVESLPSIKSLPTGSAFIGVLRYINNGQPDGHRIAYYLDYKRHHHFFDPNFGEVIERSDSVFYQWLKTFLLNASYQKFEVSVDEPFMTLYLLRNISSSREVI